MAIVPPDPAAQRRADWAPRHAEMRSELLTLFMDKTIMWRMIRLLGHRRTVARFSAVVQSTLLRAHAANASAVVKRMVDPKRGTGSLVRLLESIAGDATDLTRASYVERWPIEAKEIAERRFTRMAGRGPRLTRRTVLADQAYLRGRTQRIVDYANAYIAHRGAYPTPPPSFRDLRLAIEAVVRINNKYAELLGEADARLPVILEAWESIFYEPWLTKRRRGVRTVRAPMVAKGRPKLSVKTPET